MKTRPLTDLVKKSGLRDQPLTATQQINDHTDWNDYYKRYLTDGTRDCFR
jgi:hypothetical protein